MTTREIKVRRFSTVSSKPFNVVLDAVTATIGRPQLNSFREALAGARSEAEMEGIVNGAVGLSGLMEFTRFDMGEVLRKGRNGSGPKIIRLVVGNPLVMKEMAKSVPDAASYAPVTILVDEREGGVHLSYDLMASYLSAYGDDAALAVATELDSKIVRLIEAAAKGN